MPLGPPIVIADTYRVAFEWANAANGQKAANVMNFHNPAGTSAGLIAALTANVTAAMWRTVNLGFAITQLSVLKMDGVAGLDVVSVSGAQWKTNYGVDDGYETQNSVIVSLRTGLRGPRHRGRLYLPATDEVFTNAGSIDPTVQGVMQTAWGNFLAAIDGTGYLLCIASRKHLDQVPVSSIVVEGLVGTQRRRQQRLRRGG